MEYRKPVGEVQVGEYERSRAIAKANRWTARHAERLDMAPEATLALMPFIMR